MCIVYIRYCLQLRLFKSEQMTDANKKKVALFDTRNIQDITEKCFTGYESSNQCKITSYWRNLYFIAMCTVFLPTLNRKEIMSSFNCCLIKLLILQIFLFSSTWISIL